MSASVRLVTAALLGLSFSTAAFAQSYTAPAGIPAVTAPGGVEGRAAVPNLLDSRNVGEVVVTGSIPRHHAPRYDRNR